MFLRTSLLIVMLTFCLVMVGAADSGPVTIISASQPQTTLAGIATTTETDGKTVTMTRLVTQSQATALPVANTTSTLSLQTDSDGNTITVLVTSVRSSVTSAPQVMSSASKASESLISNATSSESSLAPSSSGSSTSAAMNSKPILRAVLLGTVGVVTFSLLS